MAPLSFTPPARGGRDFFFLSSGGDEGGENVNHNITTGARHRGVCVCGQETDD